jgi:hypothetical protein
MGLFDLVWFGLIGRAGEMLLDDLCSGRDGEDELEVYLYNRISRFRKIC